MKKFLILFSLILTTIFIPLKPVIAEQNSQPQKKITAKKDNNRITVLGEFEKLENGNWLNLTTEQKLEDFDYMYETLKENYPYFHVLKRMYDVDIEKEYKKYREEIKQSKTDAQFYVILEKFSQQFKSVGHFGVINPLAYPMYVSIYDPEDKRNKEDERIVKIGKAFENSKSKESYEKFKKIFDPVYERVQKYYENNTSEPENTETNNSNNVECKIIEEDKIAYINIKTFDMGSYDKDEKILFDFYEKVKDYENVIFDFSENPGGGMSYFDFLVVAPNIDKALSTKAYLLMKDGENNQKFMNSVEMSPKSEMPNLPRMNQDDLNDLDLMLELEYKVEPMYKEKKLKGKLWILVSERVFSSSEYAAMFTKATGFATLVGTQTGGDGIGTDPLPIIMPNSGIILRYSPIYGVTPDGASSQEFGTKPDIITKNGETYLESCLKAIRNKQ